MEAEDKKKKRRNKKKKTKPTDNGHVSSSAADNALDANDTTATQQPLCLENIPQSDDSLSLQSEAKLKEIIKELQEEKELQLQKEASLEGTIKQLETEKGSLIQKEAMLEGTIKLLRDEKDAHMQKQAKLEDTIKLLREESDSHIHREAILQKEIVQLQSEKDSWLQKEASLQEKIQHLESDRSTWILKEDSFKEMIATQTDNIDRLQAQVLELEQSRNNLVEENKQLMGNLYSLDLQIKDRESVSSTRSSVEVAKHASEREDLNSQIEAACALVEKLITENADLVEKVNELYVELEQHSAKDGLPSTTTFNETVVPFETACIVNPMPRFSENISTSEVVEMYSNGSMDSQQAASLQSNGNLDIQHLESSSDFPMSYESSESEIVQIPSAVDQARDLELQSVRKVQDEATSLTDAPLIGAPFRLVSFVARYVSGADLVNKS